MAFWTKKESPQTPIQPKVETKEASIINLGDVTTPQPSIVEEPTEEKEELETYDDESEISKQDIPVQESFETEDPEVLELYKKIEEVKAAKMKAAAEKARKEAEEKERQYQFSPDFSMQQQPQIVLVDEKELLKLIYEKLSNIEMRLASLK